MKDIKGIEIKDGDILYQFLPYTKEERLRYRHNYIGYVKDGWFRSQRCGEMEGWEIPHKCKIIGNLKDDPEFIKNEMWDI